jgi:dTMP kinase
MRFVVIEGLDGSGKSTQLALLKERLNAGSVPYKYLHFPRLEEGVYGRLVARYLRGELGDMEHVDPYLVALIFAGDRVDAASLIRKWMEEGFLVIVDRYVYSNIAFQCAKLDDRVERDRLRDWILEFEFGHLNVPFEFTRRQLQHMRQGADREYLRGERDIHEEDLGFQEQVRQEYLSLHKFVNDLVLIDCTDRAGGMRSPASISEIITKQMDIT